MSKGAKRRAQPLSKRILAPRSRQAVLQHTILAVVEMASSPALVLSAQGGGLDRYHQFDLVREIGLRAQGNLVHLGH